MEKLDPVHNAGVRYATGLFPAIVRQRDYSVKLERRTGTYTLLVNCCCCVMLPRYIKKTY